jgi:hypothetical protein
MERIELDLVANTGEAQKNIDQLTDSVKEFNEERQKANDLDDDSIRITADQNKIIRLFDQATGGAVTRVKSFVEGIRALIIQVKSLTKAQLAANLAVLANPWVIAGAAIAGATAAFVGFVQYATDSAVPALTTLKNTFLSLGNAEKFAALQAEAFTKQQTENTIKEVDRAIAVLQAFGEQTAQIEIENQERRLSLLEKGTEEYEAELTKLLVLRAKAAREEGEKEAQAKEEGRQAKLKEIQEQEALEADIRATNAAQDEFDRGYLEEEAYQAGRRAILGKEEEQRIQEVFAVRDINDEFDPAEQAELDRKVKLGQEILKVQKESDEKLKKARQDMFLNLASIFGAETKLGKAFLVAKQLQNARELILEIGKTISFSAQAGARSTIAIAEGSAQTAKVGFPQNIPLLIGYAAQAAGIISAIRSATSAAGIPTATPAFVPASPGFSPQIVQTIPNVSPVGRDQASQLADVINNQQQRPVRAYVVSTDVSTAQQLDRNIVEGASI